MKNVKACLALLLALCLLLGGCAAEKQEQETYIKFSGGFYEAFDTFTTLSGYAKDQKTFDEAFAAVKEMFMHYHRIYDGYNAYEGINNLYYVNRHAAQGPVKAEPELIELLVWLRQTQPQLRGRVNVAMGAVLQLWHAYREAGVAVPEMESLKARAQHVDFDKVIIDEEAGTVYFADPELQLDLGAVAKGYTVEIVASRLLTSSMPSYIISAGGNVRCGEKPLDGRARWGVSIQDPDDVGIDGNGGRKDILYLTGKSVVTSGDYQRYYMVDGVRYHHIIDPDTLMPGGEMRAVTIVTQDSGLADALSTAVFLMPYEEGRAFVDSLAGVEAYWVFDDGSVRFTEGMAAMLQSQGASGRD